MNQTISVGGGKALSRGAAYVVFGEALTDFIHEAPQQWRSVAGGSCWNVARVAARLGLPTGFAGAVSQDAFGDEIVQLSRESGLDMRFMQQIAKSPLLAMVVSKHPPQYFFVGDDSADLNFDPQHLPSGWLADAQVVHFGSISLAREPLAGRLLEIAERVHAAGKRISFDPNFRKLMGPHYQPNLRRIVALADYIKVSDEDLTGLFPSLHVDDALAQLRQWAPGAWFLFTRGAAGLNLITPERSVYQSALPITLADTLGGGDASMGGWIYSILNHPQAEIEAHAAFAAATAAAACQQHGAYAPCLSEVLELLAQSD